MMFVLGFGLGLVVMAWILSDITAIKSEVKIEPQLELIVKDNKVDTLYVYKNKK